ncbi:centrosomal protein of 72 kDa isoform X5 [Lemur catta]|uniref:centrosomal protein of 72 kDa isoform X5 n=1 Tax=Lemur catta TaxID=9447 RepID=UPI001E26D7C3|nr:centrosomal protein of 72 kDa isoform X5 [Lemur catta]
MASATRKLVLSEETVRAKSGLAPHRDLAELQSLSIPGTYQEKITHLGNSLMNLTGLKSLDLSRNSLVSLEGIQYLTGLQTLSLYYNCISSLAEVFRLHPLAQLADVDFRLNPVVKNESDYRLFVVHMLPKLRQLESRHLLSPWSARHQCGDSAPQGQERRSWPRGCCVEKQPPPRGAALEAPCTCGPHTHFPPHSDSMGVEDSASSQKSSLSGQKVLCPLPGPEKYRKRRMPGGRFQGPLDQECLSCLERTDGPPSPAESLSRQNGSEGRSERTFSSGTEEPQSQGTTDAGELSPRLHSAALPGDKAALEVVLLEALLDLVDRYWEGSRSLHSHEVFLAQARHILSSVQEFTAAQDNLAVENEKVSYLTLENESLQSHLASQQQWYAAKMGEVTAELSRTRKEMDDLRQHLDKSLEENSSLKSLLFSMKKEVKNADASATLSLQITGLETSVKRLSGEIVELKQHLEHYDKIQELTQMLQESHSSLVSTNEHLLQELSQARARHRAEVEHMHWSYQELKKTMTLCPHNGTSRGGCLS